MSNYTRELVYLSETDVNGLSTGSVLLTTTRPSVDPVNFYTFDVRVLINQLNNVTGAPVISIGTNSPNFNNIVNQKSIGGGRGAAVLATVPVVTPIPPGTDIFVVVNTATTPSGANPQLTFKVTVIGLEIV